MTEFATVVQRMGNYCNMLRDDGDYAVDTVRACGLPNLVTSLWRRG